MSKYWKPKSMTKKEMKCFGPGGKLKIIKQWQYEGRSYSARRDTQGYITIIDDQNYYSVSFEFCFLNEDIDNLARKLGVME